MQRRTPAQLFPPDRRAVKGRRRASRKPARGPASGVKEEDLADHLPLPVKFQKIEEAGEAVARPVVLVDPDVGACPHDIDRAEPDLDTRGGAVLVVPVEQALDRAAE